MSKPCCKIERLCDNADLHARLFKIRIALKYIGPQVPPQYEKCGEPAEEIKVIKTRRIL